MFNFLKKNSSSDPEQRPLYEAISILLEIARIDGKIDAEEQSLIEDLILMKFPNEDPRKIFTEALASSSSESSLYPFTRKVNAEYSKDDKKALLSDVWQVIIADGVIDPYEETLYFKVADLINVPRSTANQVKQENS